MKKYNYHNYSEKIEKEIKEVSEKIGISKEDFLINAVLYYFQILGKKMELKKELEVWEKINDEDFLKFEKSI